MTLLLARAITGAALVVLCAAPGGANAAAAPSPSPTSSAVPEIGRVSTSDRQDEPLAATTRTTYVVTKADLIAHGDLSVAHALERVPGVSVVQYGALGSLSSVTIRGSSSAQVLTLLDGRPISGAQIAGVDLGALSTAGVERIEVVEGGGATLYGTGANGGVINIITTNSASAYGPVPLVTLRAGSYGERSVAIETKNFAFERLLASNAFGFPAFAGDPAGIRVNDDVSSTTFRARTSSALGALRVSGSAGLRERQLGIPGELDYGTALGARENNVDADVRASVSLVRARATTTLDLSGERETLASYDFDGRDTSAGAPFLDLSVESNARASLRNVVASAASRVVYGVDLARGVARNGANGAFAATPFAQTALFVQDSLQVVRGTRVYAGLRGERDGALGGAVTPSVGAGQALGAGMTLKANYSTAFRVPTQQDLSYPGFANPALRPEHTNGYDLAVSSSHLLGGASIGYFSNFGIDQIVLNSAADNGKAFGPGNEPLVNARRTSVAGFTGEIATLPFHDFVATLNITDTYRALDLTATATRLRYVPVLTSNLELAYAPAHPRSSFTGFGVSAHTVGARFPASGIAPTYTRIDAYLRYRAFAHAVLTLRLLNVGDERYTDVAHYPAPGRAIGVELSTR